MGYADDYPTHSRTSCSDENPGNYDVEGTGCHRCNALFFDRHLAALVDLETQKARAEKWKQIAISMHSDPAFVRSLDKNTLAYAIQTTRTFEPHLAALYAAMLQEMP